MTSAGIRHLRPTAALPLDYRASLGTNDCGGTSACAWRAMEEGVKAGTFEFGTGSKRALRTPGHGRHDFDAQPRARGCKSLGCRYCGYDGTMHLVANAAGLTPASL